jgi:L-amino acid N-acyltransferase YncA
MITPVLRASEPGDIETITSIYRHHVLQGLASFEEMPPDAAEMARRRQALLDEAMPYLVLLEAGQLRGYAYVGRYRPRAAYRYTVEDSLYLAPEAQGRGLGTLLLTSLIEAATARGFRQMVAVIGDSANDASIRLHAKVGFRPIGQLQSIGFKFGRWVDSVLMQRALGSGDQSLP